MMDNITLNQAYVFFIFILSGIIIGILFDIFRILRRSFKTADIITYLEDVLFWMITGILLLYLIFKFNNGQLRIYIFIGIAIGVTFYLLIFSKPFIKINVAIINTIKTIIQKIISILLYPFKLIFSCLRKFLLKPISFIFINIRKFSTNSTKKLLNQCKKIKKFQKKSKNTIRKEGFWCIM